MFYRECESKDGSEKKRIRAWEQLLRARHLGDVVEVQTHYAQRAFDAYTSEWTKLGEMCVGIVRDASRPVEDASRKLR
jgi:hypothetical protein